VGLTGKKIGRVLLIFPPVINVAMTNNMCELPLGLASLAAWIKDRAEVFCLDAAQQGYHNIEKVPHGFVCYGLSDADILKRIEQLKPDLVGFSCLFSSQFPIIRRLTDEIKKLDPGIVTVAGGTHPSFLAEQCLATTQLDYIILAEGELAFARLLDALNGRGAISEIPGLAFRANGQIRVHREPVFLDDLSKLPFPARELFDIEGYFKINIPMQTLSLSPRCLAVSSSRGCPYRCGFCSSTYHWGLRYRTRPADQVLAELEDLKARYQIGEIKWEDDNITGNKERARRIFSGMVDRKLNLHWNTPNGIAIYTLDRDMLALMKESGCYEITVAVESGDPGVLKNLIKKPVDLRRTAEMIQVAKQLGLGTNGYFIIGFPGETREQIMHTVDYARSLELDRMYIFMYTPLPGSPFAGLLLEQGKLPSDYDFEAPANYFKSALQFSEVPPEELLKIHRAAFWSVNLAFLYKHPLRSFKKYWRTFANHPAFLFKFFRSLGQ